MLTLLLTDIGSKIAQIAIVAVFFSAQLFPAQVLAFSNSLPNASTPFVFKLQAILTNGAPASYPLQPGAVLGVTATAYSSTTDQTDGDPFITASGARVAPHIIAANFAPLGTRVNINGKEYEIGDRLNPRYVYRVDFWKESREAARQFGVQTVLVEIVSLPER